MTLNQLYIRPTLSDESSEILQTLSAKFSGASAVAVRFSRRAFVACSFSKRSVATSKNPSVAFAEKNEFNHPLSLEAPRKKRSSRGMQRHRVGLTSAKSQTLSGHFIEKIQQTLSVKSSKTKAVACSRLVRRPVRRPIRRSPSREGGSHRQCSLQPVAVRFPVRRSATREGGSHRLSSTSPALTTQKNNPLPIASPPHSPLLRHLRTSTLRPRSGFETSSVESQTYVSIFNDPLPATAAQRGFAWN